VAAGISATTGLVLDTVLQNNSRSSSSKAVLQLKNIVVVNAHDEPHEVSLQVQYDGKVIINERRSLGTSRAEQSVAFGDLPPESGEYQLTASLQDGQVSQLTPKHYPEYDCAGSAVIMVSSQGELSPFFTEPCQPDVTPDSSTSRNSNSSRA